MRLIEMLLTFETPMSCSIIRSASLGPSIRITFWVFEGMRESVGSGFAFQHFWICLLVYSSSLASNSSTVSLW